MSPFRLRQRPVTILLIEDRAPDARLIEEILVKDRGPTNVRVVEQGDQALDYLRRDGNYVSAPRPHLIVLDLGLPGRSGIDVLREIKSDPAFCDIPIVVFTTSAAPSEIQEVYQHHANAYIVKPVGLDAFTAVLQELKRFWLDTAQLPE
jgi:two-component system response regulator